MTTTILATLRAASFQYKNLTPNDAPPHEAIATYADPHALIPALGRKNPIAVPLGLAETPAGAHAIAQQFATTYSTSLRHAGSLAYQRAAHRIVGLIVGTWVMGGNLKTTPTHLLITSGATSALLGPFRDEAPNPEIVTSRIHDTTTALATHPQPSSPPTSPITIGRATTADNAIELGHNLINATSRLRAAFHTATGVGQPNLNANTFTAAGGLLRNLVRKNLLDPHTALTTAQGLQHAHPQYLRAGWFETLTSDHTVHTDTRQPAHNPTPPGAKLAYYRTSCCHWYTTGADNCDWCCHRDEAQRRATMTQALF
ncbi:hypothetical protein [Corynebacterium aquilae]|uniref:Ferric siderophore reductase C-terminal domain-containing protein n=1 Tax=Corynebacterium aquilae DSM 44791 TaxID=1431546 RepID=A0A1L7CG75_9CORY|nr:hypothetical protein [Corynebacterium aquilae]APT84861.1 hypothetical protein CAQU_07005 [Corynebacterium aquilae DSM 44791]